MATLLGKIWKEELQTYCHLPMTKEESKSPNKNWWLTSNQSVIFPWSRSKWDIWCLLGSTEKISVLSKNSSIRRRADQRYNCIGYKRWWHANTHAKGTINENTSSCNGALKHWTNTVTTATVPESTKWKRRI